jgi:hypothetical protein
MTKRNRSSNRSNKRMTGCGNKSIFGGNGAAEHGVSVYGGVGQQQAGQGNLILMRGGQQQQQQQQQTGCQTGGQQQLHQQGGEQQLQQEGDLVGGKTVIGDLLVPAGFLLGSQYAQRRSKKRGGKKSGRKSRRNRRSRRRP